MVEFRIPLRIKSKARIEAIRKGKFDVFVHYDINENFFVDWSPQMAWVLGLLYTDGFIDSVRVIVNVTAIQTVGNGFWRKLGNPS